LTHSAAPIIAFKGGVKERRSELALSEAEGVNPEPLGCTRGLELVERQAPTFMLGSRRVDFFILLVILKTPFIQGGLYEN
jgi:hypothetical protein